MHDAGMQKNVYVVLILMLVVLVTESVKLES